MLDKQRLRSFVLGGLAGALAGILLAPKSGKETRGTIADRAGEARERGRERYFDTQEGMRERFSATRGGEAFSPRSRVDSEPPAEEGEVRERPVLRDVSRDAPTDDGGGEVGGSEELRRKVRETRDRLRDRVDGPMGGGDEK